MQTSFRAKELELIANSRKGIATRTILKVVNVNQKLLPFISVLDIMKTEIGSGYRLIHVLQETIH